MRQSQITDSGANAIKRAAVAIAIFLVLAALLFAFGPEDFYPWAKAIHVVAVISWMAGMLYLPRLFVYHAEVPPGSERAAMLVVMERRLLRGIMNPAMIATYGLGITLVALNPAWWTTMEWLHAKIALVVCLTIVHMMLASCRRAFAEDRNRHSQRFFRILNEVPALLLVGIVLLVVLKPF